MNGFLMLAMVVSLGLISVPTADQAWPEEGSGVPPVAQTVVREGDFAIALAEALGVGSAQSEAEAERDLVAVGISPPNGWISDYPVTPDVIDALYKAVGEAADAGRLNMTRQMALEKYEGLTASLDLPIRPDEDAVFPQEEPAAAYGPYSDPSVIGSYYYSEGPPLVTYYTPPWDYYYNYRWVPYPFWWNSYWFSGFFILNDFHTFRKVVIVKKHGHKFATHKRVTNHFFDKKRNRFGRVDPLDRLRGHKFGGFHHKSHGMGFWDNNAGRGSDSVSRRHAERARSFGDREINRRTNFSSGSRHDGFRGQVPTHRFDSSVRKDRNTGPFGSNDRARHFRGSGEHRGMGHRLENRSSRFEKSGAGGFGRGREFRNPSFSSGGSRGGERTFSKGGSTDGRGLSRGGGSGGRAFSGSRGSGRGGGGGCRGRC
jgi:hypothetical protein